jgi:hypothetical protein
VILGQPVTPVIIEEVGPPTPQVGVADVLIGSFGIVGLMLLAALIGGLVVGALFVLLKHWMPENPLNGQDSRSYLDLGPVGKDQRPGSPGEPDGRSPRFTA